MTRDVPPIENDSPNAGGIDPNRKTLFWKLCRTASYIGCILMFDLKTYGAENVPRSGGVLLISNHQSYLDPVLLGVNLPRPMSYLAKSELFENSFFRRLILALRALPLRQGRGDKGAIEETIRLLREGHVLCVYPEGTRTLDGEIAPMQRGVALIVRRANVPIVPAVIDGSFDAWPKRMKLFRAWPIRVMYGPPLDVAGLRGDEIVALVDRTLRTMFDELRAQRPKNPARLS